MGFKIDSDSNRFKDIVRGKVKSNLKKLVSSQDMLGQQGSKQIKIPIHNIDLPRFTFGGMGGGSGQGSGDVGDPMGGQPQPGDGQGKAGNEKGDHAFSVEFTPEELAQMLGEELELPDITHKGKGKIGSQKSKYNSISRQGVEGLRHFRRTFKEALKRQISSGSYNPNDPMIIPRKDDRRYKTAKIIPSPEVNACVIFLLDVSGSVTDDMREIVQSECWWMDCWLRAQYKGLETRFLIHDTESSEVSREQFFTINSGGGTSIASGYKYAAHLLETDYPASEWNSYLYHASDGDNWSESDNNEAIACLKDKILPNVNAFWFEQITTPGGSGEFFNTLNESIKDDKMMLHKTADKSEIVDALKFFLGKGK